MTSSFKRFWNAGQNGGKSESHPGQLKYPKYLLFVIFRMPNNSPEMYVVNISKERVNLKINWLNWLKWTTRKLYPEMTTEFLRVVKNRMEPFNPFFDELDTGERYSVAYLLFDFTKRESVFRNVRNEKMTRIKNENAPIPPPRKSLNSSRENTPKKKKHQTSHVKEFTIENFVNQVLFLETKWGMILILDGKT